MDAILSVVIVVITVCCLIETYAVLRVIEDHLKEKHLSAKSN